MTQRGMGSARAGRRWLTGLLALVGLAWMWAAQAAGADATGGPARSVVDDRGQALAPPARVVRLVSLSPTLTESVCVLGACDRLVGVDRFSNWPESVTKLPRLGSLGSFNVEAVAALRPDLVLMAGDGPLVKQLARLGVPVLVLSPQRHADVADTLTRLARVLGLPPARAQQVWENIRRELHDLAESLPARDRGLRTWVEIDPAPWLAGPDSFLGETLALLGLANVVPAGSAPFVPMSREWALQADPQLFVISDPQRQGLAALRARLEQVAGPARGTCVPVRRVGPGCAGAPRSAPGRGGPAAAGLRAAGAGRAGVRTGRTLKGNSMEIEQPPREKPYEKREGERRGLIIVNTGDGKGKSTAAFGLALRAHGRGKPVRIYQFMKVPSARFGEHRTFEQLGVPIEGLGDGFSWKSQDLERSAALAREGWERARKTIMAGEHFLVVLDEITYPLIYGWMPLEPVLETLANRPPHVHVVLTGRRCPPEIIALADTVTEMTKVKHAFEAGVPAQRGIED